MREATAIGYIKRAIEYAQRVGGTRFEYRDSSTGAVCAMGAVRAVVKNSARVNKWRNWAWNRLGAAPSAINDNAPARTVNPAVWTLRQVLRGKRTIVA